ncbi:uncharacterized protein LOC120311910 isoform X2 [Crotalus tigris]|uniref:uncharacterized protein LOC120311910 isoform X2 n=1 Tax=Crotalus tigris TaxID=88082 RepID=UPI00192F6215|nr:uncharacterized protein LOC120311910 isoform X2 [Crotalus tigris]
MYYFSSLSCCRLCNFCSPCSFHGLTLNPPPSWFIGSGQTFLVDLVSEQAGGCASELASISMKPSSGPRFGRQHFPVVYVTRFGKYHCGTKIRSGGKSPKKAAQKDFHSCLSDKASSAILDKIGPVDVAPQRQMRHPSLRAGTMQVQGNQTRCRQPQSDGQNISMAKLPGQEASKLPCSRKKGLGSKRRAANSTISGEENGADVYEFPTSNENTNEMIRKQKKKSAVWLEVFEVISKMVEENGHFRNRLVSNFHFSGEGLLQGTDINQNLQSEISFTETDEAIFGWV